MQVWMWLRRITGGYATDGTFIHQGKIKELISLVGYELLNEQVVVFAVYIEEIHQISKIFTRNNISHTMLYGAVSPEERARRIEEFSSGKIRVLMGQPEVFKHGVDLSCAGTIIYYSSPVGLETRMQSEDRVINIHTQNGVAIIDILAEKTVDEDIYESLQNKETYQELIQRMIRRGIYG